MTFDQCDPDQSSGQGYRLYGSPDSANFIIRLILEELGVPYDYVAIDRLTGEHRSDRFRRLNPQGLLPVLEVRGQSEPLFETAAILLFLADRHGKLAPTVDSCERGRFLKWLFFISNTLHSDLRMSFRPDRYVPDGAVQAAFAANLYARIEAGFATLEGAIITSGGPYLMGEALSVLDVYAAVCGRWAQIYSKGFAWSAETCPAFMDMLKLLERRPAIRRAAALEHVEGRPFISPQLVNLPGVTA